MDRRRSLLALATIAAGSALGAEEAPDLPPASDLRADARVARERRIPFVVLFSLPRCPYCNEVRRAHLLPMLRDPAQASRAIFRQVNLGSDQRIVGFDGRPTTHDRLAQAHGVRAVPVVAFWNARGESAAEPLRGMLLPDFYGAYLEAALEKARAHAAAG